MTLDKQTLIDKIMKDIQYYSAFPGDEDICIMESEVRKILKKHLPKTSYCSNTQEDTHQKTTVPNVLLYETGYKQGREDMKKEIQKISKKKRFSYHGELVITVDDLESLLSPTDTK